MTANRTAYGGFTDRRLVRTEQGYVHVWLAGAGRPVVFLHSLLSSGRMFGQIAPLLSADRLVIAPDRLGFGFSDHPTDPPSIPDYARATIEVLDELGIDQFDVVGIRTGSIEAVELAASLPNRVRRLAVVSLPIFHESEKTDGKASGLQDPKPSPDGSHLAWYWRWWRDGGFAGADVRSQARDPVLLHDFFVDHMRCLPNAWYAHHAIFDYPTQDKIPLIEQPLLVFAPSDDLKSLTERAIEILPRQAEIRRLPHLNDLLGYFTESKDEIALHLVDFLQ